MQLVWDELYKKKRVNHKPTDKFLHPAYIKYASKIAEFRRRASELREQSKKKTGAGLGFGPQRREAKILEAEAAALEDLYDPLADEVWSDQDLAVQFFLWHAYRAALDSKPVFYSDLKTEVGELRTLGGQLRRRAATLKLPGSVTLAEELTKVASECECVAANNDPDLRAPGDDPWIITRRTGNIQIRSFVASLSIVTQVLFEKALCGTVANVTNAVFNRADITGSKIWEMLRVAPEPACDG